MPSMALFRSAQDESSEHALSGRSSGTGAWHFPHDFWHRPATDSYAQPSENWATASRQKEGSSSQQPVMSHGS
jgi:hypothetical protein